MAFLKPDRLPRWANNPPIPVDSYVYEPSEAFKSAGWPPNSSPRREFDNWFKSQAHTCLGWLFENGVLADDFFDDRIHPVKTVSPAIGAGLVGTSGTAVAYVDGGRVEAADEPITYLANQDRYFDLRRDGVAGAYTQTAVASGDPEPAVPADHVRIRRVRTDATDRVQVTEFGDRRLFPSLPVFFRTLLSLGLGQTSLALAEDPALRVPATAPIDDAANQRAVLLFELEGSAISRLTGAAPVRWRLYRTNTDGFMLAGNAKWTNSGASGTWTRDLANGDNPSVASWLVEWSPQGNAWDLRYHPATAPFTWNNGSWEQVTLKHDFAARQTTVWQTLVQGTGMLSAVADRMLPRTVRRFAATGVGTVNRTLLDYSANTADAALSRVRRYRAMVQDVVDNHRFVDERTGNAVWDEAAQEWNPDDPAQGSLRETFSFDGWSLFSRAAGAGPFTPAQWVSALFLPTVGAFQINRDLVPRQSSLFSLGSVSRIWSQAHSLFFEAHTDAPASITSTERNRIYRNRMVKASAFISVTRGAVPTVGFIGVGIASVSILSNVPYRGFNCNAVIVTCDNQYTWKSIAMSHGYPTSTGPNTKVVTLERVIASFNPLTIRIFELGGGDPSPAVDGGSFVDLSGDLPTLEIDLVITGATP